VAPVLSPALAEGGGVLTVDDGASLLVHHPLAFTGWSYVVLADPSMVGSAR